MRLLMVTPYAPARDGIAVYALQEVARLRGEGVDVEVLSPWPSAAHHHADLVGPRGARHLARHLHRYDGAIIQWHPDLFFENPATPAHRALTALALAEVLRRARAHVEVRLHETDYRWARGPGGAATRLLWRSPDVITVHTEAQRDRLIEAMGVAADRLRVVSHGASFVPQTAADRSRARRALGVPEGIHLFVAIGFIQPHKGFDRAVRAFARLPAGRALLAVVGSVRVDDVSAHDHADELRTLAGATPGVLLREGYVSDEAFDMWLVAADTVVLPYREIWSSSVVERALLYGRRVIVSDAGGLPDQVRGRKEAIVVADDDELEAAMAEEIGAGAPREHGEEDGASGAGPADADRVGAVGRRPWSDVPADSDAVMAEVRDRAAAERGAPMAGSAASARLHVTAPLRQLPPLVPAPAVSARPGASLLKRLVRRLIGWELDPVVSQVNRLRQATIEALERSQLPPDER